MFAGRNIEHIRQIPEKLLDVTIQPLMFVLLFAYVFGGAIAVKGSNYREYLIGGILIQSLAFAMTGPGHRDLDRPHRRRDRPLPVAARRHAPRTSPGTTSPRWPGWRSRSWCCSPRGSSSDGGRTPTSSTSPAASLLLFAVLLGDDLGRHVDRSHGAGARRGDGRRLRRGVPAHVPRATRSCRSTRCPRVLQWVAAWNPVSVVVAAVRAAVREPHVADHERTRWPLEHAPVAAFLYCAVMLAIAVPASLRRYRARTTD